MTSHEFLPPLTGDALAHFSRLFTNFAETGTSGDTPLYEHLSRCIADDPYLLALAAQKLDSQPAPNILFAAVHHLLLGGADHPLRDYYANLTDPPNADDAFPAFRDFCQTFHAPLLELIRTHRTQTNEVNRCILLLPGFTAIGKRLNGGEAHLIELGPSAGLNLNWPYYFYDYGDGMTFGSRNAPVGLAVTQKGSLIPPLPVDRFPPFEVAGSQGIELHPLDVTRPEDARWLQALVWPEHRARFDLLARAIAVAAAHPPTIVAGNALERLPSLLADIPPGVTPIVYHTFVTYQFTVAERQELLDVLTAGTRPLYRLSIEWLTEEGTVIELDSFDAGGHSSIKLARCHPHGRWLEWLDKETAA